VLVANDVEEREEDVQPGVERPGVLAEPFHDPGLLLRNDADDLREDDHCEDRDDDPDDESTHE
jgi:hypothetical protein